MRKEIVLAALTSSLLTTAFVMTISNRNDDLIFQQIDRIESIHEFEIERMQEKLEMVQQELEELKGE